jgi:AraC-like DNA-binding protein
VPGLPNFNPTVPLLRSATSIVEAALEAGFYDQAHLTREFVRNLGLTPGAFRSAWSAT